MTTEKMADVKNEIKFSAVTVESGTSESSHIVWHSKDIDGVHVEYMNALIGTAGTGAIHKAEEDINIVATVEYRYMRNRYQLEVSTNNGDSKKLTRYQSKESLQLAFFTTVKMIEFTANAMLSR